MALRVCLNETETPLKKGVPTVNLSNVEEVGTCTPSGVITTPTPSPKSTSSGPSRKRMPDRVVVRMYLLPLERVPPSADMVVPNIKDMLKLIRR